MAAALNSINLGVIVRALRHSSSLYANWQLNQFQPLPMDPAPKMQLIASSTITTNDYVSTITTSDGVSRAATGKGSGARASAGQYHCCC
jgi:hypothetical protein